MQEVKISDKLFNSLEFDTLLTLEQAQWYTQNEGFIPIPRKSNKKNIYVIFTKYPAYFFIDLKKKNIITYRISKIVDENYSFFGGYIITLELETSNSSNSYYFDFIRDYMIIKTKKISKFYVKKNVYKSKPIWIS